MDSGDIGAAGELIRAPIDFSGDYASWAEARAASTGYDAPEILERVAAATRRVEAGAAAYERDGVTFARPEPALPLLAGLLYAAARGGNALDLVDVGGALGSTWRQNRRWLAPVARVRWSIVEQPHVAAAGRAEFERPPLRFFDSLAGCFAAERPAVALLCSVLPYVEAPYALLAEVFDGPCDCVLVDRTPFFVAPLPDRLTVERVPPEIYPASYPAWFLGLERFRRFVAERGFEIALELDSWERFETGGEVAPSKFFLLERRARRS